MQSEWGDGRGRDIEGTGNTHAKAQRQDQAPEAQCGRRVSPAGLYQPERHWYLMLSVKESLVEFKCNVVLVYILRYHSSFSGAEKSLLTLTMERRDS